MTVVHARWAVRVIGVAMLALGLVIWTGSADAIIPVHMLLGLVLVIALWTLAVLAQGEGANMGLVVAVFALGLVLPLVGASQESILPGSSHWIVQIVHLALGVLAIGLADTLAGQVLRSNARDGEAEGV